MAKKKLSLRTQRREKDRQTVKFASHADRLAKLEKGGSANHPLLITSSSQVDVYARSSNCPLCEGTLDLLDHTAETISETRLRIATVRCKMCGSTRRFYFQIVSTLGN